MGFKTSRSILSLERVFLLPDMPVQVHNRSFQSTSASVILINAAKSQGLRLDHAAQLKSLAFSASASFPHPHRLPQCRTHHLSTQESMHVPPQAGFVPLKNPRLPSCHLGSHPVDFTSMRSPRYQLARPLSLEQDSFLPDGHAGA